MRVVFLSRLRRLFCVAAVTLYFGAMLALAQADPMSDLAGRSDRVSSARGQGERLSVCDRHAESQVKPSIRSGRKTAFDSWGQNHHYAEVELTLDEGRTLGRIRHLPKAPWSSLEILEGGTSVRAQWPAEIVADLIEEGAEVLVLRDFMLSDKPDIEKKGLDKIATTTETQNSGHFSVHFNDTDLMIPEGNWTCSAIEVNDVPENAIITSIDIHYKINHSYVGDIVLELSDQTDSIQYRLRDEQSEVTAGVDKTIVGVTALAGEPANQTFLLWATDLHTRHGGYIDSWSVTVYYEVTSVLAGGDACSNAVVVEEGVPYEGTTVGATGDYVTWCSERDTRDVWHVFTPTQTGLVTIDVVGQRDFDPTLAVFDRCSGQEMACSDDTCDSYNSKITMCMIEGTDYYLRVAGHGRTTGTYTLTVDQHAFEWPDQPVGPSPSLGAGSVVTDTILSWNYWTAVVNSGRVGQSRSVNDKPQGRSPKIIYGDDNRLDEYEVTDSRVLALGDSTVILVYWDELTRNWNGTYTLPSKTFAWWYEDTDPIETGNALCDDEPYRDQPAPGFCSGVLVAPDLVATAGHCVTCADVTDMAAVFGFVMSDALTPVLTFNADQVYRLTDVVAYQQGYPDWSLVRLDREVTNHTPVNVRISGRSSEGQALLIVGHPYGIPRKYDAGGTLRANTAEAFFEANLDAYPGSSGSGVFHGDSREVEGLLTAGFESFEEDLVNRCDRSRVCPDTGCPGWEYITRATAFGAVIPSFDVYFGTDSDDLELVSAYSPVPWYDPGRLQGNTVYYWQVVARNAWTQVQGPVWWFITGSAPNYSPIYRFWSPIYTRHFYTISQTERDKLVNYFSHTWTYEGVVYYTFATDVGAATSPVYRFWSERLHSHFYTIDEAERDKLIDQYSYTWTYEGPVFYAYPKGQQPDDASPVYRFWSDVNKTHFYTISEDEKNKILNQYSHIYLYEGVVWYAYR